MLKNSIQQASLTFCLLIICSYHILGQTKTVSIDNIIQKFDQYSRQTLQEKIYLHTDQSTYLAGEIIWFKVYCVDGRSHQPLDISKIAYLEVIDQDQRPVLQSKITLVSGSGNGSFFLPASLNSGNYLLRAYTNWMKNSGPEYYFEKPIAIINTFKQLGLQPAKDTLNYDIQFFPEGGSMVQNITGKVAFRATDRYGKGINFQGAILTQENDTIVRFQPQKFGIGHFNFMPLPEKKYRAVIKTSNGKIMTHSLPAAEAYGYTMSLQASEADQIKVTVKARLGKDSQTPSSVYLVAHTRQVVKVAEKQNLQQNEASFTISKKALGDGISHITIFNASNQPLCERLYFNLPEQRLIIEAEPDQKQYTSRKQVSLDILTRHTADNPFVADLSVAVYKADSLQTNNMSSIVSYLWLTSDLAGKVESPHYYFNNFGPQIQEEVDNLMLTHGWRKFKWQNVLDADSLTFDFIPEYEGHLVQGRIMNTTNSEPASSINTYLSVPGRYPQFHISRSNEKGEIQFVLKETYGTRQIITQTNSQKDSLYRIELFSPYSQKYTSRQLPYFNLPVRLKEQLLTRSISMQAQNTYFSDRRNRFTSPLPDTSTIYGIPDARYNLDEYTRFPLMEDVLKEYVPGVQARKRRGKYHLEVLDLPHKINFNDNPLVLVDGVPVFNMDRMMAFDPLKVKRLDVLTRRYFYGPSSFSGVLSYSTYTGEAANLPLDQGAIIIDFEGLQLQREFYQPVYDNSQQRESRLPDFRHLLYWSPTVKTDRQGRKALSFYTSDLEGEYVIVVEGITKDGDAGYTSSSFTVQNPAK